MTTMSEWVPMRPARPAKPKEMLARLPDSVSDAVRLSALQHYELVWDRYEKGIEEWWINGTYVAILDKKPEGIIGPHWHLSVRREDREPIRDWRDMQNLKNDIVGPEREAVELYPAESRLVDAANQFHLWILPTGKFAIGWPNRAVGDVVDAAAYGAVQRPVDRAERRRLAAR